MQATSIYQPVQDRLARVQDNLGKLSDIPSPFLSQLLDHVFHTVGKMVRPAITLLASNFNPHDEAKPEIMAAAVEILHIATLIHDDTVDNSNVRRGRATISHIWGRNAAVLAGDYIFAKSATFVCDTDDIRVIRRFSETIMELSSGELQEMADAYNCNQTMEQYLERIYNKTSSLFTTAGLSGAILSGVSEDVVQKLRDYGYNLGMAFQIIDDILDFEATEEEIGKPVGSDLSHGIMTLPAIMAMERNPKDNPIATLFQQPQDPERLRRAVDMILNSSVIDDSFAVANDYCNKALANLSTLPQNPSRDSLEELVGFILKRRV
ncbi:MAG: polyprenyl synthetase family protein [Chloroflexi bacterium]|nr:polyprenyl synthetase family protein [Chloroflexota bacterium]